MRSLACGVLWLGTVALFGCDATGDDDAGVMTGDGGGMDAGGDPDAGPDDAGRTADVSLGFRFPDGSRPVVDGLELCVPEYPTIPCGTPGADDHTTVRVPLGRQYVAVTAPGHVRMLFPLDVPEDGLRFGNIPYPTTDDLAFAAASAAVTLDDERGHMLVGIDGMGGSVDPEAVAGATISGLDGTTVYAAAGAEPPVPDPSLDAVSAAGAAFVFNVSPGEQTLSWTQPGATCDGSLAGWDGGETASRPMPFEPGAVTLSWVDCEGLVGRDQRLCDPVAQDCDAGEKCRAVFYPRADGGEDAGTMCVPDGSVPEIGSCMRTDGVAGDDDCAAGTYCAYFGLPRSTPQERRCLSFCAADGDCDTGEVCLGLATTTLEGVCTPTCDPFGDDCAVGTHCSPLGSNHVGMMGSALVCNFIGTGGQGDTCVSAEACQAGMACPALDGGATRECRNMCNATHACPGGGACTDYDGVADVGFCPVES